MGAAAREENWLYMEIVARTDWLATRPVFYHEVTGKWGYNINQVIDWANAEFDVEGIYNYLEFGYSVFEQTPVKHVKFLPANASLVLNKDGRLSVIKELDPAESWCGRRSSEKDVLDLIEDRVQWWEKGVYGEIVIPTSGGYDSRLLNLAIKDPGRIRSFTYGVSQQEERSFEAVYARELSKKRDSSWELIRLGEQHNYFQEWDDIFGAAVNAQGLYHYDFYRQILPRVSAGSNLLSGIFGDVWAGNARPVKVGSADEVALIGYTHGIQADPKCLVLKGADDQRQKYWEENRERINDPFWQIVMTIRLKIMLISYLIELPRAFGLKPWSPFNEIDVALGMLTLSDSRRNKRVWQGDYFKKRGFDFENQGLEVDHGNSLDKEALRRKPLVPLKVDVLREIVKPNYVDWINRRVQYFRLSNMLVRALRWTPGMGPRIKRRDRVDPMLRAYYAYLTLKPLESFLRKRNNYGKS